MYVTIPDMDGLGYVTDSGVPERAMGRTRLLASFSLPAGRIQVDQEPATLYRLYKGKRRATLAFNMIDRDSPLDTINMLVLEVWPCSCVMQRVT